MDIFSLLLAITNIILNLLAFRTIFILACIVLFFLRNTVLCTMQESQNKRKYPVFGSDEYWCTVAF